LEVLLLVHLARADHQAYFLQLNLEVGLLGHQRGPDSTLEANHLAREDQVEPQIRKAAEL